MRGNGTSMRRSVQITIKTLLDPEPSVPRPRSRAGTPDAESDDDAVPSIATIPTVRTEPPLLDDELSLPPRKKSRSCGICKKTGHNSRTCPDKIH